MNISNAPIWTRLVAGLALGAAAAVSAQERDQAPVPPPAEGDAVEGLAGAEEFEPEVTIVRREGELLEEYRINGRLYKVKVTPEVGPPYYLLYPQGEAGPPVRRDIGELQTPFWIIFSW